MTIESRANGTDATMSGIVDRIAEVDEKSAVAERTEFVVQSRDGYSGELRRGSGTMCPVFSILVSLFSLARSQ